MSMTTRCNKREDMGMYRSMSSRGSIARWMEAMEANGVSVAVIAMTVAPCRLATSTDSSSSFVRPEDDRATTTSRFLREAAFNNCEYPSLKAAALNPCLENRNCASCATTPEWPDPYKDKVRGTP